MKKVIITLLPLMILWSTSHALPFPEVDNGRPSSEDIKSRVLRSTNGTSSQFENLINIFQRNNNNNTTTNNSSSPFPDFLSIIKDKPGVSLITDFIHTIRDIVLGGIGRQPPTEEDAELVKREVPSQEGLTTLEIITMITDIINIISKTVLIDPNSKEWPLGSKLPILTAQSRACSRVFEPPSKTFSFALKCLPKAIGAFAEGGKNPLGEGRICVLEKVFKDMNLEFVESDDTANVVTFLEATLPSKPELNEIHEDMIEAIKNGTCVVADERDFEIIEHIQFGQCLMETCVKLLDSSEASSSTL